MTKKVSVSPVHRRPNVNLTLVQRLCWETVNLHMYIRGVGLINQPFQAGVYHCHLHPQQAANCCRISRLVVDEDDLMWLKN